MIKDKYDHTRYVGRPSDVDCEMCGGGSFAQHCIDCADTGLRAIPKAEVIWDGARLGVKPK